MLGGKAIKIMMPPGQELLRFQSNLGISSIRADVFVQGKQQTLWMTQGRRAGAHARPIPGVCVGGGRFSGINNHGLEHMNEIKDVGRKATSSDN